VDVGDQASGFAEMGRCEEISWRRESREIAWREPAMGALLQMIVAARLILSAKTAVLKKNEMTA
jgi:hypothetical protein